MARTADPRVRKVIARNLKRLIGDQEVGVVASKLGMKQTQLSGYLGAHRGFAIETLIKMASKLQTTLDDLVFGVDAAYTRDIMRRRSDRIEQQLTDDLLDVITGYAIVKSESPSEAAGMVQMLKLRLLKAAGVREPVEPGDAASSAGAPAVPESAAPNPQRRRGGRRAR